MAVANDLPTRAPRRRRHRVLATRLARANLAACADTLENPDAAEAVDRELDRAAWKLDLARAALRGIVRLRDPEDLPEAFDACREALAVIEGRR